MKNICGLSVIQDYFKYSKYNLNIICDPDPSSNDKNKPSNEEKPTEKKEDVDVSSSSAEASNEQPTQSSETNSEDVSSTSGAPDAPKNTAKTVPQVEAKNASEPDADSNCKGEPAPEVESTVDSSVKDEK